MTCNQSGSELSLNLQDFFFFQRLSDNLDRYKAREKDGPVTLEEYDEVKWESERLKAECERMQKVLEQKHKKMKVLHQQSQETVKALEERLSQEEVS